MPLPRIDFNNSFANLGSAFDAQQQQAGLAQLLSEDQFKQIQTLNDPKTNLALMAKSAEAAGDTPSLKLKAGNYTEGIDNGINNYYTMKGYKQKQQTYKDIQTAYQQSQAQQRELVMGQIAADQGRRQGAAAAIPQELRGIYGSLNPAGQDTFLGSVGTSEIGNYYDPIKTTKNKVATEAGERQVRELRKEELGPAPLERNGIPIPSRINQYHQIYGADPTTSVGVNKDILDNQGKLISNQSEANKLGVQPQQLQQQIQGAALDIQIKQVQAQFAEQEKQLLIKRDQLANQKGTLDYKKGLDEYKRFEQGQALFKTLQESGALASNDPQKQAEMQAQLGVFGVKYNPPNAKYSTIKHKDGAVYQVNNTNNEVRELINRNGKPAYGPWLKVSVEGE